MSDQAQSWSAAAARYEADFIDPYLPEVRNPLPGLLEGLGDRKHRTAADLGCGVGPLLPLLSRLFHRVIAVDFAEGMLHRARDHCQGLGNVEFVQRSLTDLAPLAGQVDVAVAVNSLAIPETAELEKALGEIRKILKPGGHFLGIVPAMDAVHYLTLLLVDRARRTGMPQEKAQQNAAHHAEHALYDFAFGDFRYQGLTQHFWQEFEVAYRLKRAGFRGIKLAKVRLAWHQFGSPPDLAGEMPPWDWCFRARV